MQKFKDLPRASPAHPPGLFPVPVRGAYSTPDPELHKTRTFGHCLLACLWHDKTPLKIPLQVPKARKQFLCKFAACKMCLGNSAKSGRFSKSPRCKIGAPRRIFTHLLENIWKTTGCVTEGSSIESLVQPTFLPIEIELN